MMPTIEARRTKIHSRGTASRRDVTQQNSRLRKLKAALADLDDLRADALATVLDVRAAVTEGSCGSGGSVKELQRAAADLVAKTQEIVSLSDEVYAATEYGMRREVWLQRAKTEPAAEGRQSLPGVEVESDLGRTDQHEPAAGLREEPLLDNGVVVRGGGTVSVDGRGNVELPGDVLETPEVLVLRAGEGEVKARASLARDLECSCRGRGADRCGEFNGHDSSSSVGNGAPADAGARDDTLDPTEEEPSRGDELEGEPSEISAALCAASSVLDEGDHIRSVMALSHVRGVIEDFLARHRSRE